MSRYLSYALVLFGIANAVAGPIDYYWSNRTAILEAEDLRAFGGHLQFLAGEKAVNDVLMAAKQKDLDYGFQNPSKFCPAINFMEAKKDIESSEVFRLIQRMPKGGDLHVHSKAVTSSEYIFNKITYMDNLYVCDKPGKLTLRFFKKPDSDCDWKLLSKLRQNPQTARPIDDKIRRALTMLDLSSGKHNYDDGNVAWQKFESIFKFLSGLLKYKPAFEDYLYQGLQELYNDNGIYMEIRAGLGAIYDLDGTTYSPVQVAQIFKDISDKFAKDHPKFVGMKLVYSPGKTNDPAKFDGYMRTAVELRKALPDFVVGFDLTGQEDTSSPLLNWVEKMHAIAKDVPFFFHAGETNWHGRDIDENLLDAVLLNAKRIGHGYALLKHPKVAEMIKARKIAIEVCPISNQVLNLVKDLRNHPASGLFVEDFPVVIANDDPTLWGAYGLTYDFYEAFMGIMSARADIRAIRQLTINSIQYSSLNENEKKNALKILNQQWIHFIETFKHGN